jgi:hypothetical protein
MRPVEQVEEVRGLVEDGLNDGEIARRTGIPLSTVRKWRTGRRRRSRSADCAACGHRYDELPPKTYSYLLGVYLGDGHIAHAARGVYVLRIYCTLMHANIWWEIAQAIDDVRPDKRSHLRPHPRHGLLIVSSYWKHWPCLFPQHGTGRKHERLIALTPWQQQIVNAHPEQLLRGLIHSDGWRGVNRVRKGDRRYAYSRYMFVNESADIRELFCRTCDAIGVEWRQMNRNTVSVARRDSVARLDEFIGPKS